MSVRLLFTIFYIVLISFPVFSSGREVTKREYNYLREGPASYYKIVEILPPGKPVEIIETRDNWNKVKVEGGKVGWLSVNCITPKQENAGYDKKLQQKWSPSRVSKTGLAAAIKGLRKKFRIPDEKNVDEVLSLTQAGFTAQDFQGFNNELSKSGGIVSRKNPPLNLPREYNPSAAEMQVGAAVSARLVSGKLLNNPSLQRYLELIHGIINSNTFYYDWHFSVAALDDKNIDGYAAPGGYIMLTKGAIKLCDDEAELAFLLAHEMAHIIMGHGIQELGNRELNIKADDAFAEMEDEFGEEATEEETDLETIMLESYERVVNERLLQYETEADKIAAVFLSNCGYDPMAAVRVSKKLADLYVKEKNIFSYTYGSPNDAVRRYEEIKKFCELNYSNSLGARMESRFRKNINTL